MAQYYAYAQGNRQETHRLGSKSSGAEAGARGWDIGGRVWMKYDEENKRDVVSLYLTSGSRGARSGQHIGDFFLNEKGEYEKINYSND